MLDFYDAILGAETLGGGGGGGSATLITKNIDANGTYSASSDNADGYSAVTVTVPNTYTQSDEGKVVDNGALVAQTAYPSTITTNNTYDTTNYNSVTVNVPTPQPTSTPNFTFFAPKVKIRKKDYAYSHYFDSKTWNLDTGVSSTYITAAQIWTDGVNIYCSYGSSDKQYVLDKETSTWSVKNWGLGLYGSQIWSDGVNIYYSRDTEQYVLDVSTGTWSEKNWNGYTPSYGSNIWTDKTNIYYSDGTSANQWVLDVSTSTWSSMTWGGSFYPKASKIWTDGSNIFLSDRASNTQKVLSGTSWSNKTWAGTSPSYMTNPDGEYIWSDGDNIYYSEKVNSNQYNVILSKDYDSFSSTWKNITFGGTTVEYGSSIWTDGTDVYYQYTHVLRRKKNTLTTCCKPSLA